MPGIKTQTRAFLDAYARGDHDGVLALTAPDVTIYGSDAAEVFHGRTGVENLLADDQKLWRGKAVLGPMEHVTTELTAGLASIFFDASFSVGGRPAVPVRFAMIWRRAAGKWLLVQSSNVVPTVGQSAAALLHKSAEQAEPR
ncbi:MAG TPA: nuclear transport factor 2 family protein [Acidisarcina sp.]